MFDDIGLGRLQLDLFGNERANYDPLAAASTARQLFVGKGMIFAAHWQKVGNDELATRRTWGLGRWILWVGYCDGLGRRSVRGYCF